MDPKNRVRMQQNISRMSDETLAKELSFSKGFFGDNYTDDSMGEVTWLELLKAEQLKREVEV